MKSIQETLNAFSIGTITFTNRCMNIPIFLDGKPFNHSYSLQYLLRQSETPQILEFPKGFPIDQFRSFLFPSLQPICNVLKSKTSSVRCSQPLGHSTIIHTHCKGYEYTEGHLLFEVIGENRRYFCLEDEFFQNKLFYDYHFHKFSNFQLYTSLFNSQINTILQAYPLTALTKQNVFDYYLIYCLTYHAFDPSFLNVKIIYNLIPFIQDRNSPDPIKMSDDCIKACENEIFFKNNKEYIKDYLP